MQPHAFRQLLCHTLCAQKQIGSSYNNQPPKWPCQRMTWKPPGLRKPSKDHFLIFHRYSTKLFRGWTCLLDFCKLLANMGLWKVVNFSAFDKPDASKIRNVSGFCKNRSSTRCSSYIYVIPWNYVLIILKTAYAILISHTMFLIYICAFVKIN